MELDNNVRRLLKMVGVKSLSRNIKTEDDAIKRDINTHHKELWGGDGGDMSDEADDDMGMMAARDIIIHAPPQQGQDQSQNEPEPESQEQEPEPVQPPPVVNNNITQPEVKTIKVPGKIPGWQAALAAASLAAGGAGVGYGLSAAKAAPTVIEKAAVVVPDKNRFDIGLLPPDP